MQKMYLVKIIKVLVVGQFDPLPEPYAIYFDN